LLYCSSIYIYNPPPSLVLRGEGHAEVRGRGSGSGKPNCAPELAARGASPARYSTAQRAPTHAVAPPPRRICALGMGPSGGSGRRVLLARWCLRACAVRGGAVRGGAVWGVEQLIQFRLGISLQVSHILHALSKPFVNPAKRLSVSM